MPTKLLDTDIIDVPIAGEDDSRVRRLESDLRSARLEAQQARNELETAQASIHALRQQLLPLHRALKAVFGEIEMVVGEDNFAPASSPPMATSVVNPKVAAVWESWKTKLGGQCAKIIDVLLTHHEMNTTQLSIAIQTRRQNIPNLIYKLNQAGLINKNGGKFSLKEL